MSINRPHRADDVRLSKLHYDGSTAKLMTRVARVPVIVLCVTVDQRVTTSTDTLDHTRTALHCCNIL